MHFKIAELVSSMAEEMSCASTMAFTRQTSATSARNQAMLFKGAKNPTLLFLNIILKYYPPSKAERLLSSNPREHFKNANRT